jgi:hypothetical protein
LLKSIITNFLDAGCGTNKEYKHGQDTCVDSNPHGGGVYRAVFQTLFKKMRRVLCG